MSWDERVLGMKPKQKEKMIQTKKNGIELGWEELCSLMEKNRKGNDGINTKWLGDGMEQF